MKLLSKDEAQSSLKKENESLVETNIRLRQYWKDIVRKLNTVKENYEPDKLLKLKEFENFVKEIVAKKSKLLQELKAIENEIEKKKELYYSLVAKQDLLDEKVHQIKEQESKLKLREVFVADLEAKWQAKNADVYNP